MNKDIELQINDIEGINLSLDVEVKKLEPPLVNLDIVPGKSRQVFKHEGEYGYDVVTVEKSSDENLIPENVKDGVEILGVTGNYKGAKYTPKYVCFYQCKESDLSYEVSNLDTGNFTTMYQMFYACGQVTKLDLSHFNTSNVTDMSYMFNYCQNLKSLNTDGFDTSNVTNMQYMFYYNAMLTELDLSHWDVKNVSNFNMMFYYCKGLKRLNLSTWKSNASYINMDSFLRGCSKLEYLDMRNFDFTKVSNLSQMMSNNVPTTCEIIVKDDTQKEWWTTKFPSYTNVKTVLEL